MQAMPLSVEVFHIGGRYAQEVAAHLAAQGQGEVRDYALPANLPLIVDDPQEVLPPDIGGADIVIAINQHQDILVDLPKLLGPQGARAFIAPIESPEWIRPGLTSQVTRECARFGMESAFPKPFCALDPQTPVLTQFCEEYKVGRPALMIEVEGGAVASVEVPRGAPCGLTNWCAKRMPGQALEAFERKAVELLHLRPCLATQVLDPATGDTIMHASIHLMEDAAQGALAAAKKS